MRDLPSDRMIEVDWSASWATGMAVLPEGSVDPAFADLPGKIKADRRRPDNGTADDLFLAARTALSDGVSCVYCD